MRLTSKIFIGIFIAVIILSICVITSLANRYDNDFKIGTTLQNEQVKIDIPSDYKVILLKTDIPEIWKDRLYSFRKRITGSIDLKKATSNKDISNLLVTKELKPYISQTVVDDTLSLHLDLNGLYSQYYDSDFGQIKGLNFTIYVDSLANIVNKIPGINISLKDLNMDQIRLSTLAGNIDVQNSNFSTASLFAEGGNNNRLILKKCNIDTLNLDLNNLIWKWDDNDISEDNINVINLTGKYKKDYYYGKSMGFYIPEKLCKTVNWIPKDDNTAFKLEIMTEKGKPASFIIPQ